MPGPLARPRPCVARQGAAQDAGAGDGRPATRATELHGAGYHCAHSSCGTQSACSRKGGGRLGIRLPGFLRVEKPNNWIVMLIAGVTVFGAVVVALQTDANARAIQSVRQAQVQSLVGLQNDVSSQFELGYDLGVYRTWLELFRLSSLAQLRAVGVSEPTELALLRQEAQRMVAVAGSRPPPRRTHRPQVPI